MNTCSFMARLNHETKNRFTNVLIIVTNLFFVFALFFGELFYIRSTNEQTRENNRQIFLNTNISLGSMTKNYLIGESHLCRSWGNYLNHEAEGGRPKTMEEAIRYLEESITDETVMGHIVYNTGAEAFKGYSTKARKNSTDNTIDYNALKSDVFSSVHEGMNISSSYMNPINISKSLAFFTEVQLVDPNDSTQLIGAYLLRVILLKNLKDEWTFPSGSFDHLEVAIIDANGKYILSGNSFYNESFFEYYRSYNATTPSSMQELTNKVSNETGYLVMNNHSNEPSFIAYSQIKDAEKWTILTYIPLGDIENVHNDWLVIGTIGIGLGMLFVIDLTVLLVLNKNLKSAAKVAEDASKAKTDFLSTMSHDIRTPMNAIVGLTLIAKNDQRNPESTQDALNKIETASNHLLTLINDILDLSKVESGKIVMNPISFHVVNMIENVVNISQPMAKAKHIDFSVRVHNFAEEWLCADQLRLSQIVNNLVSNALKYTGENGKVTIHLEEQPSEQEGHVKFIFVVEDSGIGMSPEFLSKLYTPFSRATDSRVNSIQGTGLGLAITKQMVDLMNGAIDCQSTLGEGTKFTVTIDLSLGEKPHEEQMLTPIDVLIVDDEIGIQTAQEAFESVGAKVDVARSEEEVLNKLADKEGAPYKLLILGWMASGINGVELLEKIHHLKQPSPVTFVAAYDCSEIKIDAKEAEIAGFITKPVFHSKAYQSVMAALEGGDGAKANDEMEQVKANILIVEDNDINWEVISTILEMYGSTCSRAENGKVAYELVKEHRNDCPYDLIFMDIQMPVMNGLDATRAIRQLDFNYARNVPIVAMTADAFSENVAECLDAGMNGHIAKPIDPKLVLAEIRKALGKNGK